MLILNYFLFVLIGLCAGGLSSFFGIGGGVIIVPGLYFLFQKASPIEIIAVSHFLIFLNSSSNIFSFWKRGLRVPRALLFSLLFPVTFGMFLGHFVIHSIEPRLVKLIFSIILLLVALKPLLFGVANQKIQKSLSLNLKQIILLVFFGVIGGVIAAITGLGGGIVLIPLMISCAIPSRFIAFLSNIGVCGATFFATILNISRGGFLSFPFDVLPLASFHIGFLFPMVSIYLYLSAILGRKFGLHISDKVEEKKKGIIFSILLIILSIHMFLLAFF